MKQVIFLFALALFSPLAISHGDNSLIWFQPDFPPYVIIDNQNLAKGIDNRIAEYMITRLPEYNHAFQTATYKRLLAEIKRGQHGIITPLFRTREREKYTLYTKTASYLVLPNNLIISKTKRDEVTVFLTTQGEVDLEGLVRSDTMKIGISAGRSYSGIIDETINSYKRASSFLVRSGLDISTGLLKMLDIGRIDAWIAFPVELSYSARRIGIDEKRFSAITVADMEPFTPVFFGAPKNAWGARLIASLNRILAEPGTVETFLGYYATWLSEDKRKRYWKLAKSYYGRPFQPPRRESGG